MVNEIRNSLLLSFVMQPILFDRTYAVLNFILLFCITLLYPLRSYSIFLSFSFSLFFSFFVRLLSTKKKNIPIFIYTIYITHKLTSIDDTILSQVQTESIIFVIYKYLKFFSCCFLVIIIFSEFLTANRHIQIPMAVIRDCALELAFCFVIVIIFTVDRKIGFQFCTLCRPAPLKSCPFPCQFSFSS